MTELWEQYVPVEQRLPNTLFATMQLRWAIRESGFTEFGEKYVQGHYKVLQQLWRSANGKEEWRDIPEEPEATMGVE